jgi:hypothetical protein
VKDAKRLILKKNMAGDIDNLASLIRLSVLTTAGEVNSTLRPSNSPCRTDGAFSVIVLILTIQISSDEDREIFRKQL